MINRLKGRARGEAPDSNTAGTNGKAQAAVPSGPSEEVLSESLSPAF